MMGKYKIELIKIQKLFNKLLIKINNIEMEELKYRVPHPIFGHILHFYMEEEFGHRQMFYFLLKIFHERFYNNNKEKFIDLKL